MDGKLSSATKVYIRVGSVANCGKWMRQIVIRAMTSEIVPRKMFDWTQVRLSRYVRQGHAMLRADREKCIIASYAPELELNTHLWIAGVPEHVGDLWPETYAVYGLGSFESGWKYVETLPVLTQITASDPRTGLFETLPPDVDGLYIQRWRKIDDPTLKALVKYHHKWPDGCWSLRVELFGPPDSQKGRIVTVSAESFLKEYEREWGNR